MTDTELDRTTFRAGSIYIYRPRDKKIIPPINKVFYCSTSTRTRGSVLVLVLVLVLEIVRTCPALITYIIQSKYRRKFLSYALPFSIQKASTSKTNLF
jgi:hypothetical protein